MYPTQYCMIFRCVWTWDTHQLQQYFLNRKIMVNQWIQGSLFQPNPFQQLGLATSWSVLGSLYTILFQATKIKKLHIHQNGGCGRPSTKMYQEYPSGYFRAMKIANQVPDKSALEWL